MRTIKFRAWDKTNKLMFEVMEIEFKKESLVMQTPNKPTEQWTAPFHLAELMQFTGLTDKNGKEIYEGDVVVSMYDDKETDRVLVEMTPEFYHKYVEYSPGFPYYEVMGNIYENPELL